MLSPPSCLPVPVRWLARHALSSMCGCSRPRAAPVLLQRTCTPLRQGGNITNPFGHGWAGLFPPPPPSLPSTCGRRHLRTVYFWHTHTSMLRPKPCVVFYLSFTAVVRHNQLRRVKEESFWGGCRMHSDAYHRTPPTTTSTHVWCTAGICRSSKSLSTHQSQTTCCHGRYVQPWKLFSVLCLCVRKLDCVFVRCSHQPYFVLVLLRCRCNAKRRAQGLRSASSRWPARACC